MIDEKYLFLQRIEYKTKRKKRKQNYKTL